MYLNEEEIIKSVLEYINDNNTQAIMIDGDWGSGKTYFAREKLKKQIKSNNDLNALYVPLYGVSSEREILSLVYQAYSDEVLAEGTGNTIQQILKLGQIGAGIFNVNINESLNIDDFVEIKNSVLIFDDLERTTMDINTVLGYLNVFAEHKKLKVILIANEEEIGRNHEEYFRKKEKLISHTIKFVPLLEDKYDLLAESINNQNFYFPIFKNELIEIFRNRNYYNLRTLKFALLSFNKIFNTTEVINHSNAKHTESVLRKIFVECINKAIGIKEEGAIKDDESKNYIEQIKSSSRFFFIENYMNYYVYNEIEVSEILLKEIEHSIWSEEQSNLSFLKLHQWRRLEEPEIRTLSQQLFQELKQKKYTVFSLKDVLGTMAILEINNLLDFDVTKALVYIAEILIDGDGNDLFNNRIKYPPYTEQYEDINRKYYEYVDIISEKLEGKITNKLELDVILNQGFSRLKDFISENYNEIYEIEQYVSLLNIDDVSNKIKSSKPGELSDFSDSLQSIYHAGIRNKYIGEYDYIVDLKKIFDDVACEPERKNYKYSVDRVKNTLETIVADMEKIKNEKINQE